jgi:hypothetical protein
MRQGIKLAVLSAFLSATLPAWCNSSTVPDWVKQAAAEQLPSYPADTRAVVLLEETTLVVKPDGKSVERVRRVVKILRPRGRNYGEIEVHFNANSKVNFLHVWSIGPDGHEYAVKDNEVMEVGTESWGILYEDERAKVVSAPARDVNAVIAYEYEQRVPFYESEDTFEIQESIPKRHQRFTLQLPPGWEYNASWHRHAPVEPYKAGDQVEWSVDDTPALDVRDIPAAPAAKGLRARGVISYYGPGQPRESGDWRAIGAAYQRLAQDRARPSPELTAKAKELVAGKTDFADKVQAISEFVQQQIRYVAIEIGIGGLQPHAAADIFHSRYGDCKDKATLLAAMLSAVDIHSTWVLVDTERGFMSPDAPSVAGNHAIAAIQLPEGYTSPRLHSVVTAKSGKRFLIFDPTWEYTPFGVLESNLQGSYGILVDGNDSQLVALPVLDPQLNSVSRTAHFKLAEDGSLKGEVTVKRNGDIAAYWRSLYREGSEKDQRKEMTRVLGRDLGDFTLGHATAENTYALTKDFIQEYDVTVPLYARSQGPLMLMRPRVLGTDSMELDKKIRTYPVELGETRTVKDEFDIDIPEGYTVDEIPDPVTLDMGFAAYQSRTEMHGSTLHYSRQYTVREVEVPSEKYHAVQELIGQIENDERSQAVFKKKAGAS